MSTRRRRPPSPALLAPLLLAAGSVAAQEGEGEMPWSEWLSLAWARVDAFLSYQLTKVQDSEITVGKVLAALVLVILGHQVSRLLSRAFGQRILGRFQLDAGPRAAIQTITFYLLMLVFVVWALHLVEIPLTVFTVLGGALAIGVGFGSQNIVNNFISGLIMLIERPIKVGDLIDVDGVYGRVQHIGARSTRIRAGDNTHVIVPNSSFLESNVLNWTLSDALIRLRVDVGVAYGSPTDEVAKLFLEAMEAEEKILKSPAPEVLFAEFGDNALLFQGYFWTEVRQYMDAQRVQSAVRFRLDQLYREAGIVIAFPQRDVHLDTLSPLRVELLGGAGKRPESAGPES